MKTYKLAWTISILVITGIIIISAICSFAGVKLPDALIRLFGVLDLAAIVVLVFTSVKMRMGRKGK